MITFEGDSEFNKKGTEIDEKILLSHLYQKKSSGKTSIII